jgi:stage II sporulation protein D
MNAHYLRKFRMLIVPVLSVIGMSSSISAAGAQALDEMSFFPVTVQTAVERYYAGDIEGAIESLQMRATLFPADHEALHNLALLLREAGRFDEAVEALTAAVDSSDDSALVRELGITLALAGRAGEAIDVLERLPDGDPVRKLWLGIAHADLGDDAAASSAFAGAAELQPHFPYAYLFRGMAALEQERWTDAISYFNTALRQDANITSAFLPLAEARIAIGEIEQSHSLLGRAQISRPWDEQIRAARLRLEDKHPELLVGREAAAAARRVAASPPRVAPVPDEVSAGAPSVRIGLAEGLASIHLKTGDRYTVTGPNGSTVADGGANEVLLVERIAAGRIAVSVEGNEPFYRGGGPLEITYSDPAAATMVFDVEFGYGQFGSGREDRSYRGLIRFLTWADRGFTIVNELDIESYLLSVVPSEMPASWPEEALRAQAVAARSYTLAPNPRFHPRGFDLLSSVTSHYYQGIRGEHPRTTEAVLTTAGLVLMGGRHPLSAVYSANTAGYTESSESVWGFTSSLVGVSDPLLPPRSTPATPAELEAWLLDRPRSYSNHPSYSALSAYRWSLWVSVEELAGRIGDRSIGRITGLVTRGRGTSGRVEVVEVVGTDGTTRVVRDAIRSRLGGLRGNLFNVSPRLGPDGLPTHFVFTGASWGHGVGMCQSGAAGMAAAGFTGEEILAHYYPRAPLEKRY